MKVVRLEPGSRFDWPAPAVTIGNFDGVHRGHQALVATAVEEAHRRQGAAAALTFDPHPARVLDAARAGPALTTLEQKAELLSGLGLDALVVVPFDAPRAAQSAEAFVREVLAETLHARAVVVGRAFRFGHDRAGDAALLARLGEALGFAVQAIAPVEHEGEPISSTRVRRALQKGRVEEAAALLGRPYFVDGTVARGEGRGRALGVPTANLDLLNEALPALGVYAGWCRLLEAGERPRWPSVVNVGTRPTFAGRHTTVEAHLLDRDLDLYGRHMRLEFVARLRDEQAFPGPQALVEQIRRDIERARPLLDDGSGRKL
ncbi:MAG TPA: bifunctional riboflavin kinase/FAD synthetase [Vicinamibacteria bacterium]